MKIRINILFILLLLVTSWVQAGELKGKVVLNGKNAVIPNAKIKIEGEKYNTVSDANGNYSIKNIKAGTYAVYVYAKGYDELTTADVNIKEDGVTELNFMLERNGVFPLPPAPPAPIEPLAPFTSESDLYEKMIKGNDFYKKAFGEKVLAELKEIKELDNKRYNEILRNSFSNMVQFNNPFDPDKEKYTLRKEITENEIKTELLAARYLEKKGANKEKIKAELQTLLREQFDLREKSRKQEVEELSKELTKLKRELEKRSKNKEKIIQLRLDELLGEDEYLEW